MSLPVWHQYAHDVVAAYEIEEPLQQQLRPLLARIESAKKGASGTPDDVPGLEKQVETIRATLRKLPNRVGKLAALACKRHLNDLKAGHKRGLSFDEAEAGRWIKLYSLFTHIKGQGGPLILEPWQQFIVANIFGWKRRDGRRRFRRAYTEVARKNGKTTLVAPIGIGMMIADREEGAECYSIATTAKQAREVFDAARAMGKKSTSPKVASRLQIQAHNIHDLTSNSKFEPLSSDSGTKDGMNPHFVAVDEYHAHPDDSLYNVLASGMGARQQPLMWTITTAGFNKLGPCKKYRDYCERILNGDDEDDAQFCIIYTLDDGDDWQDSTTWVKANPNLGVSVLMDFLREQYKLAAAIPEKQVEFKTKHLNQWTDAAKVWIPAETWSLGDEPFDVADLYKRPCYGGLDLASVRDICSLELVFPPLEDEADKRVRVLCYNWVPEDGVVTRSKADKVPYQQWVEQGFIEATPGNVTDYSFIEAKIIELCETFDVHKIGYDRFNASQLVINLTNEGVPMSPFGQGFVSMSAPTKELERLAFEGLIQHGGNPVLAWALGNVALRRDPAGNIKPDKEKSGEKIDPVVSLVMGIGEWMTERAEGDQTSVYDRADAPSLSI